MGNAPSHYENAETSITKAVLSYKQNRDTYVWDKVLGTGKYATVYNGYDRKSHLQVAVKKVNIKNIHTRKQRTLHEINILQQISTLPSCEKYFLCIRDAFTDEEDNIFIVSKLIPGFNLLKFVKKSRAGVKEPLARQMMRQILTAVHILHENNIAHRDIKLENIMYDNESKRLKLIDFGFAIRTVNSNNSPILVKEFCGSMHYVSPEIREKKPYDAKKADIWALGVLVYIVITGKFPFDVDTSQNFPKSGTNESYTLSLDSNEISQEAKSLISRMLSIDPTKRPSTTTLLSHAWWTLEDSKF